MRRVAGADEAGRGALAGPLVVAAVCLDVGRLSARTRRALSALNDSKLVSSATRDELASVLWRDADRVVVRMASSRSIDRDGLHRTNLRLLRESLSALEARAGALLVDGFSLGAEAPAHHALVRGDGLSASVAAASIIAKTVRDRLMRGAAAEQYPAYRFDRHVGYGTAEHLARIETHGPCAIHRQSFRWGSGSSDQSEKPPSPG